MRERDKRQTDQIARLFEQAQDRRPRQAVVEHLARGFNVADCQRAETQVGIRGRRAGSRHRILHHLERLCAQLVGLLDKLFADLQVHRPGSGECISRHEWQTGCEGSGVCALEQLKRALVLAAQVSDLREHPQSQRFRKRGADPVRDLHAFFCRLTRFIQIALVEEIKRNWKQLDFSDVHLVANLFRDLERVLRFGKCLIELRHIRQRVSRVRFAKRLLFSDVHLAADGRRFGQVARGISKIALHRANATANRIQLC